MKTLEGHLDDGVIAAAFSPDGQTLASGGNDKTVRLWDVQTGAPKAALEHGSNVYEVAFSSDGKIIASAGHDGTILLWSAAQ